MFLKTSGLRLLPAFILSFAVPALLCVIHFNWWTMLKQFGRRRVAVDISVMPC